MGHLEQLKPLLVKALDKHLCFGLNHLVSPKYFSIGTFLFTSLAACLLYVTVCAHQSNDNDSAHTYVFLVDDDKIFKIDKIENCFAPKEAILRHFCCCYSFYFCWQIPCCPPLPTSDRNNSDIFFFTFFSYIFSLT